MGSALVFMVIAIVMMFVAGVHWGYFLGGIALVGAATPLIWTYVLKQLQKDRFLALIYPDLYPDIIYQQQCGLNAIGAGGITGQGLFKGAYTQAGAVPESQNDMIFSVVGEELGFIGCITALLLIVLITVRIIYVGKKSRETIHQSDLYGNGCNDNRANDYKRRHVFNAATRHRYNASVFQCRRFSTFVSI